MDDLEQKRRQKSGAYSKQEVLKMFTDLLEGKTEGIEVEEFVIVCRSRYEGEPGTDIFSTTGSLHETVGMLEVGKLFTFDHRDQY